MAVQRDEVELGEGGLVRREVVQHRIRAPRRVWREDSTRTLHPRLQPQVTRAASAHPEPLDLDDAEIVRGSAAVCAHCEGEEVEKGATRGVDDGAVPSSEGLTMRPSHHEPRAR